MDDYFYTESERTIEWLANALMIAKQNGRPVRLHVDSVGRLRVKVGGSTWSAPIESDIDLNRDLT